MTPKILKYINQEKQDKFSCKRENTCKSMEFTKRDNYFCAPTVSLDESNVSHTCLTTEFEWTIFTFIKNRIRYILDFNPKFLGKFQQTK